MIRVADSAGLADLAARARPSVPGIRASSSTSANGRPRPRPYQSASRASRPSRDRRRLGLPAAQPLLEDLAVGRVVVDDEDAQAVQVDRRPPAGAARRVRLQPELGREAERAAPARLALHADLPAHQRHQPGGDRQAQPGAAVLPRRRAVRLLEGPEDLSCLSGGMPMPVSLTEKRRLRRCDPGSDGSGSCRSHRADLDADDDLALAR